MKDISVDSHTKERRVEYSSRTTNKEVDGITKVAHM